MNVESSPLPDSEDDRVLDTLLAEACGAAAPPDLTQAILSQLGETPASSGGPVQIASPSRSHQRSRTKRRRISSIIAAIATVAACVALVVFLRSENSPESIANDPSATIAKSGSTSVSAKPGLKGNSDQRFAAASTKDASMDLNVSINADQDLDKGLRNEEQNSSAPAIRGVPMIVKNDSPDSTRQAIDLISPPTSATANKTLASIDAVASKLDQQWRNYWMAIGVTPSAEATPNDVANRMSQTLNVALSGDVIGRAKTLRSALVSKDLSKQIARAWLASTTGIEADRLKSEQFATLLEDADEAFRADAPLDEKLVTWMRTGDDKSSVFYDAFAAGGHDAMVRRLASVTMDVDLRCTKCHDSLIEGNERQKSYWSFSNFLRNGLQRSRSGKWTVASKDQLSAKSSFYELPDGRQRFVQPTVDAKWISSSSSADKSTPDDIVRWANRLKGSPELARGMVNSVWQMVHGRSLRGHVIDQSAAPHHPALNEIQDLLSDDLIASNFDIARTIALVMTSPPSFRSVPKVLLPQNQLMASSGDLRDSLHAVDAFAASGPLDADLPLPRRLALVMKSVGGSLKDLDGGSTLLANIGSAMPPRSESSATAANSRVLDGVDFPSKADELPVQWLSSIDSYENRVQHLGFLANQPELPKAVTQAATALRQANDSENLALHRVWWLIRP